MAVGLYHNPLNRTARAARIDVAHSLETFSSQNLPPLPVTGSETAPDKGHLEAANRYALTSLVNNHNSYINEDLLAGSLSIQQAILSNTSSQVQQAATLVAGLIQEARNDSKDTYKTESTDVKELLFELVLKAKREYDITNPILAKDYSSATFKQHNADFRKKMEAAKQQINEKLITAGLYPIKTNAIEATLDRVAAIDEAAVNEHIKFTYRKNKLLGKVSSAHFQVKAVTEHLETQLNNNNVRLGNATAPNPEQKTIDDELQALKSQDFYSTAMWLVHANKRQKDLETTESKLQVAQQAGNSPAIEGYRDHINELKKEQAEHEAILSDPKKRTAAEKLSKQYKKLTLEKTKLENENEKLSETHKGYSEKEMELKTLETDIENTFNPNRLKQLKEKADPACKKVKEEFQKRLKSKLKIAKRINETVEYLVDETPSAKLSQDPRHFMLPEMRVGDYHLAGETPPEILSQIQSAVADVNAKLDELYKVYINPDLVNEHNEEYYKDLHDTQLHDSIKTTAILTDSAIRINGLVLQTHEEINELTKKMLALADLFDIRPDPVFGVKQGKHLGIKEVKYNSKASDRLSDKFSSITYYEFVPDSNSRNPDRGSYVKKTLDIPPLSRTELENIINQFSGATPDGDKKHTLPEGLRNIKVSKPLFGNDMIVHFNFEKRTTSRVNDKARQAFINFLTQKAELLRNSDTPNNNSAFSVDTTVPVGPSAQ